MPNKKLDWIQTAGGRQIYPLDPDPDLISIKDIAHALSNQCRFGGHCRQFYSVGQHSAIVCEKVREVFGVYCLEALLHDAAEAYLVDLPRPVKYSMPEYVEAEKKVMAAISKKFNLHYTDEIEACVKRMDDLALWNEGKNLMPDVSTWNIFGLPGKEPHIQYQFVIEPCTPWVAERMFLYHFEQIQLTRLKE